NNLGSALYKKGDLDGATTCFKEAIRLNPKYASAHNGLGWILKDKNDLDTAIACFKEAIRLDPKSTIAHFNLGIALVKKGDLDGAIASYKEATQHDPENTIAHFNLGIVLVKKGDLDGAIASYKLAIRINPNHAPSQNNLGNALKAKGDLNGAIVCFKEAIRLDPKFIHLHCNLGNTLKAKGDLNGAIDCFKEAIRLDQNYAPAHDNLGWTLRAKGDLNGAIDCFKEVIRLDPKNTQARKNLLQTTQWQSLVPLLEEVANGRARPRTPIEACNLAMLSAQTFRKQYAIATRLYADAFADMPKLVEDLDSAIRYNAACCAVLAGCGKGIDSPDDANFRFALRRQALGWLQADLAFRTSLAKSDNPAGRQKLVQHLGHWLSDLNFVGVRPGPGRIEMPAKEQADWDALWVDVGAVLAEVQKLPSPRPIAPPPREVR
ncbi:MAG TPA: tetratricopeptide repeat protein, partial [Gemmata sp.]|nr:tetratricopeptide repeat protein [Gemmata sp.]